MSGDFYETKRFYELQDAAGDIVRAAEKVHKKVTSQYRTQRCVLELKDAVEKFQKLRDTPCDE